MAQNTDFYITKLDQLPTDPVKTSLWRVIIPNDIWKAAEQDGLSITNFGSFTEDDFHLHVQSAELPKVGVETKTMDFFGLKKYFATNVKDLHGTKQFKCMMLEDMRAYQALVHWNQTIVNAGILKGQPDSRAALSGLNKSTHDEVAGSNNKAILNHSIKVQLYNFYEHKPILTVNYINAMCTDVGTLSGLTYDNPNLGQFDFTLTYDRFEIDFPEYGSEG